MLFEFLSRRYLSESYLIHVAYFSPPSRICHCHNDTFLGSYQHPQEKHKNQASKKVVMVKK